MKKPTQRARVKAWLLERGSITNSQALHEMKPEIRRLSERIRELEAEGMVIVGDWLRDTTGKRTGDYLYTLTSAPKPPPKLVPVIVMRDGVRYVKLVPEDSRQALASRE